MQILPTPIRFDLVASGDVEAHSTAQRGASWRFTGNDPWFIMTLSRPMQPGMYKFELVNTAFEPDVLGAKLFFDTGSGFRESESIYLSLTGTHPAEYFELGHTALQLRLNFGERAGTSFVGEVRLTRISTTLHRATRTFHKAVRVTRRFVGRAPTLDQAVHLLQKSYTVLRKEGVPGLRQAVSRRLSRERIGLTGVGYTEWVQRYDTFNSGEIDLMRGMAKALPGAPLISVLMPVYNAPANLLSEAIDSVLNQAYQNWQLCIADDASTDPEVRVVLEKYASIDPRINVVYRERNGHISEASNSALDIVRGQWIALLDHDDVLRPHALLEIALEIATHPDAGLIYSDEDKIDGEGGRYDPFFKPDFSIELLRSQNYFNHLTAHRTDLVRIVGGWRKGFEGSQDYDLNLRIIEKLEPSQVRHIPKILYHWRAAAGSTASAGSAKSYAYVAGLKALEGHAERNGRNATVEPVEGLPFYRYRHVIPKPEPLVSLIIPTRDRLALIQGCVDSILEKTNYRNYEILIVDNGSVEPETIAWFASLADYPKVRVLPYEKPFNYSAINNYAVAHATGDIVGLINNDIEVISPDWLGEMVSFAVQEEIGCVGAKLYYADRRLQHAGVITGIGGVAGHDHKYYEGASPGYFSRLKIARDVSAVTAACLLVRKSVFEEAGGLDEDNLKVAFNDVDFCLKVMDLGYRNVWTPYAELFHLESVSRGAEDSPEKVARFNTEVRYMKEKWMARLSVDPFYSPNLSITHEDFSISFPPRVDKLPSDITKNMI